MVRLWDLELSGPASESPPENTADVRPRASSTALAELGAYGEPLIEALAPGSRHPLGETGDIRSMAFASPFCEAIR